MKYLIISDVHIGDPNFKHFPEVGYVLSTVDADVLVLAGDIFDFVKQPEIGYEHVAFMRMTSRFERKIFLVGNHEMEPRVSWIDFIGSFGFEIREELTFTSGDKVIKVCHGHKFDRIAFRFPWLSRWIIKLQAFIDRLFHCNIQSFVRRLYYSDDFLTSIERRAFNAGRNMCDVFIIGHVHKPGLKRHKGFTYVNSGDWVEHDSYVVIEDGSVQLRFASRDGS